jgi:hypothetical protein
MFIVHRRIWGPLAGVATALLFVLLLGMNSDVPSEIQAAAPQQTAVADLARSH